MNRRNRREFIQNAVAAGISAVTPKMSLALIRSQSTQKRAVKLVARTAEAIITPPSGAPLLGPIQRSNDRRGSDLLRLAKPESGGELPRNRRWARRHHFSGTSVTLFWRWVLRWNLFWAATFCLVVVTLHAQEAWERDHEAGAKAAKGAHFAEAEKLLSRSADETRQTGAVTPLLARSLLDLGEVYRSEGKYSSAQSCCDEALQIGLTKVA
jgi:hypothetical protein